MQNIMSRQRQVSETILRTTNGTPTLNDTKVCVRQLFKSKMCKMRGIADNLFASGHTGKFRCRGVALVCNLFISTWLARSQSTFSPGSDLSGSCGSLRFALATVLDRLEHWPGREQTLIAHTYTLCVNIIRATAQLDLRNRLRNSWRRYVTISTNRTPVLFRRFREIWPILR